MQRIQHPASTERHAGTATAKSVLAGGLVGTAIGSCLGAIAIGVALTGVDELWLAGLFGFGLWGAFLGCFSSFLARLRWDDAEDWRSELPAATV